MPFSFQKRDYFKNLEYKIPFASKLNHATLFDQFVSARERTKIVITYRIITLPYVDDLRLFRRLIEKVPI